MQVRLAHICESTFDLFGKKLLNVDPEHCYGYYSPEQPFCRLSFWTSFLKLIVLEHSSFGKMSYQAKFLLYRCNVSICLELLFFRDNFISVFCIHCLHILQTVFYSFSFFGRPCHSCLPVTPSTPSAPVINLVIKVLPGWFGALFCPRPISRFRGISSEVLIQNTCQDGLSTFMLNTAK